MCFENDSLCWAISLAQILLLVEVAESYGTLYPQQYLDDLASQRCTQLARGMKSLQRPSISRPHLSSLRGFLFHPLDHSALTDQLCNSNCFFTSSSNQSSGKCSRYFIVNDSQRLCRSSAYLVGSFLVNYLIRVGFSYICNETLRISATGHV